MQFPALVAKPTPQTLAAVDLETAQMTCMQRSTSFRANRGGASTVPDM